MTESEITKLVTKTGLKVLKECEKIVKVDLGNAFIDKETGAFYIFDGAARARMVDEIFYKIR